MRWNSVKTVLAILRAVIIFVVFSFAAEVMLDFPAVIGFGQSRLLPGRTFARMNWVTAAFLLVILVLVVLPIRSYQQTRNSIARRLCGLPRTRMVRALAGILLILGWVVGLRYLVSLDIATYQIHASTPRLEEVVEAPRFFEAIPKILTPDSSDRVLLWGECTLRDLGVPCIIEAGKEAQSVIHFRRENEAAAIAALRNAGLNFEKK